MKIKSKKLKNYISSLQSELKSHMTMRVSYLLDQLIIQEKGEEEVELFDLLVKLIFLADEAPAESIANLMVPINTENSYLLEESTITDSAAFLRDFIKKDYILYILKNRNIASSKSVPGI